MRILALGAVLILAGCNSLNSDLKTAQATCPATNSVTVLSSCLNDAEGPVWRKDSPDDAPAYQTFSAARTALAEELDSGKITKKQFRTDLTQARAQFSAVIAQNARKTRQQLAQVDAEMQAIHAQEQQMMLDNLPPPPPPQPQQTTP